MSYKIAPSDFTNIKGGISLLSVSSLTCIINAPSDSSANPFAFNISNTSFTYGAAFDSPYE